MGAMLIAYASVASDLPAPGELMKRSSQFETTGIYDRAGQLLQEPWRLTIRRPVCDARCRWMTSRPI